MHRAWCLLLLGAAFGCAKSGTGTPPPDLAHAGSSIDLSVSDSAGGDDLAIGDAAGSDGATTDGGALDAAPADLTSVPDFTVTPDLAGVDLRPPPDMTRPPCTVSPQANCNPGEKCTLGAGSSTLCVSNGTVPNGALCGGAGSDDCLAGELCTFDNATTTISICRGFCNLDGDCTQTPVPPGSANVAHCTITFAGTTAKACTFACNPVTAAGASGCASGLGCIYGGIAGIPELTDCATPGAGTDGTNCTTTSQCASGLTCVSSGGAGSQAHCRQVCRNATPGDCAGAGYFCDPPSGVTTPMFGFCCPLLGC